MRSAFLSAMDGWLKQNNKYNKNEAKITWPDVQETPDLCLQQLLHPDLLREPDEKGGEQPLYPGGHDGVFAGKSCRSSCWRIPRRWREAARQDPGEQAQPGGRGRRPGWSIKSKSLAGSVDIANRVQKFVDCRTKEVARRELYIVEGGLRPGLGEAGPGRGVSGDHARPGQDPQLPEGRLRQDF